MLRQSFESEFFKELGSARRLLIDCVRLDENKGCVGLATSLARGKDLKHKIKLAQLHFFHCQPTMDHRMISIVMPHVMAYANTALETPSRSPIVFELYLMGSAQGAQLRRN